MSTPAAPREARRLDADSRTPQRMRAWRWVGVFVAVTALHWLAAEWFERHHGAPPPVAHVRVPVQVALLKPERIERAAKPAGPAAAPPHAAPKPAPRRAEPRTLHAVTPPKPHPKAPAAPPDTQAASAPAAASPASASAAGASGTASAAPGNGEQPFAQATQASHGLKFSVPPSGELQYDTFYNGVRNQPGTIHWSSDGQRYEMVVRVPLPFVGEFSWTSRGRVDAFGLAPDQYIEKRGHRPSDVTVFNRTDRQIVFTRTPNSLALPDGAQDRFSMVMQLASLVRGDPDAYKPGVTREFYVADNDSGETWPITTIGDETVSTDHGYVTARHFMRLPRREGDKRRIDVWLAPSLGWLPVRLVQTEPNGNQFELVWRGALAAPDASAPDSAAAANAATATAPNAPPDTTSAQSATPETAPASAPAASQPQPSTQPAPPANMQTETPTQSPPQPATGDAQPSAASPGPAPEHP
ncbi:DUF3108 domain-containing protein [Paraburkholderia silvatlantica]|uniref:DUF3108 domain-containing protein n=1 Tax=Paraburkholderia silvatlantica TaxID=321895 RepID=A0ABR6FIN9_9BURK|nr:DUF3108 domain-containing protein [Paraburkholderia silvatlantica]MBB2927295.1 hypothetical protein [Paraburkholderia silvatlantica]PVY37012.1 uncharacterized protein DUF3108 [Paraburkholderia silvatlantica]PXW41710.1 uncharacterized protein DUF3108 [Paraburkholderia silvatlantica]